MSKNPSALFWFTSSEALTGPAGSQPSAVPFYLQQPETIFKTIWRTAAQAEAFSLLD